MASGVQAQRDQREGDDDRRFHGARQHLVVLAQHPERVDRRGLDRRIEAVRTNVRPQRRAEQTAIPAGVHEPGKQLRIRAPAVGQRGQSHHGVARPAAIDVDLGRQVVGQGEIRIQLEGAPQGGLGTNQVLLAAGADLADAPEQTAQPRPGRRIAGIFIERLLVEIAGDPPALRISRQLVGAEVVPRRPGQSPARRARAFAARARRAAARAIRRCDG